MNIRKWKLNEYNVWDKEDAKQVVYTHARKQNNSRRNEVSRAGRRIRPEVGSLALIEFSRV